MLYIIYGLTTTMGKISREYFKEQGIQQINKYNFNTAAAYVQPSDGQSLQDCTQEEVQSCDYIYESHGRLVGFTSKQIEAAVNGKENAFLTFSSEDLSFLREIKHAYGSHVVIIYTYIDQQTLVSITNALQTTDTQKAARLSMGASIKKNFSIHRDLFDEIVLYGGESSQFDIENLKQQYAHILGKYANAEKESVPLPYTGNKPYIFVSYARNDTEQVLPYLQYLQRHGCRIWYDKGIKGGENWMTTLAMKIKGCSQYLLFSSRESTKSVWTRREASRALQNPELSILTIRMDDAQFDEGIEWGLQDYQQLFMNADNFEGRLLESITESVIEQI